MMTTTLEEQRRVDEVKEGGTVVGSTLCAHALACVWGGAILLFGRL